MYNGHFIEWILVVNDTFINLLHVQEFNSFIFNQRLSNGTIKSELYTNTLY